MNKLIQPRLIRLKDAPKYLGMNKNLFNSDVRTQITEIPIGKRGIAFDRLDLDEWAEEYKNKFGINNRGKTQWGKKEHRDFSSARNIGTSINKYADTDFEKALALSRSQKQKNI